MNISDIADVYVPPPGAPTYPLLWGVAGGALITIVVVIVAGKFDPTKGPLTISIMIMLAFIATVSFSLYYTVPQDPTTSAVVGALVITVGAIVSYWLTKDDKGNH